MQLKIAKILNQALMIMAVLVLLMVVGGIYVSANQPDINLPYTVGCIVVSAALVIVFKFYESSWDKRVIIKMALAGKVALVNIKKAERELPMRDSSFIRYWLYRFEGEMFVPGEKGRPVVFYEKMSYNIGDVPSGSVYVTYDDAKPTQIFIVPTELLARVPAAAELAAGFEKRGDLRIKYLYAYYRRGMEIKEYKDLVKGRE